MTPSKMKSNAARLGTALGVVSTSTVAMTAGTGVSPAAAAQPLCIDALTSYSADVTAGWDYEEWEPFLAGCEADFGTGKLIVDVVTEGGEPLPPAVDLKLIANAFDFGYADDGRNANAPKFDSLCALDYDSYYKGDIGSVAFDDYRMDAAVDGRRALVLQLIGDAPLPDVDPDGMEYYDIDLNEMLFSWYCNQEFDELRMRGVADVGGGYRLLPGINPTFDGFDGEDFAVTRVTVVVSLIPPETTTTTTIEATTTSTTVEPTTTTSTIAPTTTVEATTTTAVAIIPPAPPTPSAVLPETGTSSGNTTWFAGLALALGLGCVSIARRRRSV